MTYYITYNDKHQKVLMQESNVSTYIAHRDTSHNRSMFNQFRETGKLNFKQRLLQMVYNIGTVADGTLLTEASSLGDQYFQDWDLPERFENDPAGASQWRRETCQKIMHNQEALDLRLLELSAKGIHTVSRLREGLTILENQVLNALILREEMDTNAHDLRRVSFTTPSNHLIYVNPELFLPCPFNAEECQERLYRMELRERRGEERLPPNAHNGNKHYRPWEDIQRHIK